MSEPDTTVLSVAVIVVLEVAAMIAMWTSTRFAALVTSIWDAFVRLVGAPAWQAVDRFGEALRTGARVVLAARDRR